MLSIHAISIAPAVYIAPAVCAAPTVYIAPAVHAALAVCAAPAVHAVHAAPGTSTASAGAAFLFHPFADLVDEGNGCYSHYYVCDIVLHITIWSCILQSGPAYYDLVLHIAI